MLKWLIGVFFIAVLDYFVLSYLKTLNQKYYIVLHGGLVFIGVILYSIFFFKKSLKKDLIGLVFTVVLLIKMFVMAGVFYVLNAKLKLNTVQIINFILVYFAYTLLYVAYAIVRIKHRI